MAPMRVQRVPRREPPPPHLPVIARSVWSQKRIAIRYESWSATVERKIDPLGLVMRRSWYLVARAQANMRTYKIAKIQNIEALGFCLSGEAFDLASHWRAELKRFERSLRQGEATLRISPAALSRIDRLGANVAETVLSAPPDAQG